MATLTRTNCCRLNSAACSAPPLPRLRKPRPKTSVTAAAKLAPVFAIHFLAFQTVVGPNRSFRSQRSRCPPIPRRAITPNGLFSEFQTDRFQIAVHCGLTARGFSGSRSGPVAWSPSPSRAEGGACEQLVRAPTGTSAAVNCLPGGRLFWRHVAGGAHQCVAARQIAAAFNQLCQTEVCHIRLIVGIGKMFPGLMSR